MEFFGGIPNGAGFFSMPRAANGIMCQCLAVNVLRSLQFSYMLMKGFRSTSRALRDLDIFRDEGMDGSGGRFRWRPAGTAGGGRGAGRVRTGGSSSRVGMGRYSVGRSSRTGARIIRVGPGRRVRCTGDDLGTSARGGEENLQGKVGENGSIAGKSASTVSRRTQGSKGDGKSANINKTGDPAEAIPESTNVPEGSIARAMGVGEVGVPAECPPGSEVHSGMGLSTVVDGISNQLKPMKGFMKSVKMATGVVSGVKLATGVIQKFQAPVGGVLIGFGAANGVVLVFETARMVVKGAKISKDFSFVWKYARNYLGIHKAARTSVAGAKAVKETFFSGLFKGSDGALTLVKLTKDFGSGLGDSLQDGLTNWDLMSKGYDASNSAMKVVEAFLGLKGGGVIGLVGKGFSALKGGVSGLGLSVKLVKTVVIAKKVSIAMLQGFGLSKTIRDAFKAIQDGNMMVKWITFKSSSKEATGEDLLEVRRLVLSKGGADTRTFELLMISVAQSAGGSQDGTPSLIFSLASLLLARFYTSDVGELDEDGFTVSSVTPCNIFSLSLPA